MAREVWCAAGNMMVNLPNGAFDQSLEKAGVQITPCYGCTHSGHVKKVLQIDRELQTQMLNVKRVPHLEHAVQVIKSNAKFHVQCTCNCYPETVQE